MKEKLGYHIQIFFHENLGEIGRIIILPRGNESQIWVLHG